MTPTQLRAFSKKLRRKEAMTRAEEEFSLSEDVVNDSPSPKTRALEAKADVFGDLARMFEDAAAGKWEP